MSLKVVVGAGDTGVDTAERLASLRHEVRLITRRGSCPPHPRIARIALDATDTAALIEAVNGAATLFNCAAPPCHKWATQFPPLAASLLNAAVATEVDRVVTSASSASPRLSRFIPAECSHVVSAGSLLACPPESFEHREIYLMSGNAIICWDTIVLER
ncbi:MAG: NAD-dependent epimerase/dehydratase [Mycobacterium sp.]|nr:NAD-dependent epimerase/dehydratase [Mycobacterium sp.]